MGRFRRTTYSVVTINLLACSRSADTHKDREQWVVGEYFATSMLCSFECSDKRAKIYDLQFVDFNVTANQR